MKVVTPGEVATATPSDNKYEGVMVAAAYARKLNELPKEGGKEWKKKYTTRSLEDLVAGEIEYTVVDKRAE
ncbi:MAG TPA: DNA-directed RNA polymerase subunit omega [Gemmatimonadota bacterium]|jgi:DNA-directed RNA polymerase subunit K/omega|nr:DNA-directed RNA polymerase subunit omega [Gemmatimonadota bacterium]